MNMDELIPYEEILEEQLRNPAFRAEWERLALARAVANRLVLYRADHGLSQTALARLLNISQPAVARLEAADHLPTLDTLVRLSERLGIEITVEIVPPNGNHHAPAASLPPAVTTRATTSGGAGLMVAIR